MEPIKFSVKMAPEWPLLISKLDGGVNFSVPDDMIANNELSGSLNFIYDPNTYRLMHRPGISKYSQTVVPGSGTQLHIKGCFYSSVLDKDLLVADSKLYYLDGSFNPHNIGNLNGSGYPFFVDFNGKCLIASGGVLQNTDGTNIANVSDAPSLTKIFPKDGRIWGIGNPSFPHRVQGSGPGDETDWDTGSGNSVSFDIEESVGDSIVNADVYKNNIICFKGIQQRGIYALIVPSGDYSQAYVQELSTKSSSINIRGSIEEGNDLLFLDNTGFRSLVGVQQYGDIEQDPVGFKINQVILPNIDGDFAFLERNPYYNFVLIKYADTQTCYTYNPTKKSFLPIQFEGLKPHSACYREEEKTFLIGMDDGFVYKMEKSIYTDNGVAVPAFYKTKRFTGKGGITYLKVLKSILFVYEGLATGTATIEAIIDGGSRTISLASLTLNSGHELLFEATGYLAVATALLYGGNLGTSDVIKFINFYDITFNVSNNTGAIKSNRLEARCSTLRRRS